MQSASGSPWFSWGHLRTTLATLRLVFDALLWMWVLQDTIATIWCEDKSTDQVHGFWTIADIYMMRYMLDPIWYRFWYRFEKFFGILLHAYAEVLDSRLNIGFERNSQRWELAFLIGMLPTVICFEWLGSLWGTLAWSFLNFVWKRLSCCYASLTVGKYCASFGSCHTGTYTFTCAYI